MHQKRHQRVLIPATLLEIEALLFALDNSLSDPDFRTQHMSAAERRRADAFARRMTKAKAKLRKNATGS